MHFKESKAFVESSNDMDAIEEYNGNKKREMLIVFEDMTTDMVNNKNLITVVTELFIRGRKLNVSIIFIPRSYSDVTKNIRLNSTHYFVMKISNKQELQQIAFNHSSDIDFRDFMKLYKKWTAKPYSFLFISATLCVWYSFTFQKVSFGKNINTNNDNSWWDQKWKTKIWC